ncbi:hypothetical protein [Chryseobacterium sp. Leaf394]|uniref:hypothetical protein n=1 Tax=Chryseobacterium sp. Leaf394 TaxID=1736361 RepID=UPI0006F2B342|nr:hypothetical protein [Chryseobacterium sp. Leaf394]KQS93559.1 hypothetical protein ASG21_00885 [Chryseobacterium sp. Leaf394]
MKTKIIIGICLFLYCSAFCQNKKVDSLVEDRTKKDVLEEVEERKSANWKDVITNYYQLALKDLGGEDQRFELKTTLFNLKAQANNELWIDYNYEKENFARNFQIEAGLSLKDDYSIKGFNYGLGWAYNERDRSIKTLFNSKSSVIFDQYINDLMDAKAKYSNDLIEAGDTETDIKINKISEIEKKYRSNENVINMIPLKDFPEDFRKYLSDHYESYPEKFMKLSRQDIEEIERQPYFFIGFNGSISNNTKFLDNYKIETVYLRGIKTSRLKMEIDFRNSFVITKDLVSDTPETNKNFISQLGLNIAVLSKEKSFLEMKPSFEFRRNLMKSMILDENENFFANTDIRIRIYKDVWLPLILKYDVKKGNLFGFLNVSFNFDAVKKE